MIDKIKIAVRFDNPTPRLTDSYRSHRKGRNNYVRFKETHYGEVKHTWENDVPMLVVECSLPKFLVGHNALVLSHEATDLALRELIRRVGYDAGASIPRMEEWKVRLVELSHVWEEPSPSQLVLALERHIRTRRGNQRNLHASAEHDGVTLRWGTEQWTAKIYAKGAEVRKTLRQGALSDDEDAPSLEDVVGQADQQIRFEVSMKGFPLRHWLGHDRSLGAMLDKLGSEGHAELAKRWNDATGHVGVEGVEEVAARLFAAHKEVTARHLLDTYVSMSTLGEQRWVALTGAKAHVVREIRRGFEKADVRLSDPDPIRIPVLDPRKYLERGRGFPTLAKVDGHYLSQPFIEIGGVTLQRRVLSDM